MFNFIKNFIFINLIFINILSLSSSWACDDLCDDVMDVETANAGMLALNTRVDSLTVSPIRPPNSKRPLEEDPQSSTPYKKAKTSEEVALKALSAKNSNESFIKTSFSFQDDSRDENYSPVKSPLSFNSCLTPVSNKRYKNKISTDAVWRKEERENYFEALILPEIEKNIKDDIDGIKTLCEIISLENTGKILSYIASQAVAAYSEKLEGNNTTLGTYRHRFCEQYIHALQTMGYLKHLQTEVSYFEREKILSPVQGCVRLDVYWPAGSANNKKSYIFDFKFYEEGENKPLKMNHSEWQKHVPGGNKNNLIFITPKS